MNLLYNTEGSFFKNVLLFYVIFHLAVVITCSELTTASTETVTTSEEDNEVDAIPSVLKFDHILDAARNNTLYGRVIARETDDGFNSTDTSISGENATEETVSVTELTTTSSPEKTSETPDRPGEGDEKIPMEIYVILRFLQGELGELRKTQKEEKNKVAMLRAELEKQQLINSRVLFIEFI